jgi:hypothetical protein
MKRKSLSANEAVENEGPGKNDKEVVGVKVFEHSSYPSTVDQWHTLFLTSENVSSKDLVIPNTVLALDIDNDHCRVWRVSCCSVHTFLDTHQDFSHSNNQCATREEADALAIEFLRTCMFLDYADEQDPDERYDHKTPDSFSLPGNWSFSGEVIDGCMENTNTFSILVEEEIVPVTVGVTETDRRMAAEALDKLRRENLELHAGKLSAEASLNQSKEKHRKSKEKLRSEVERANERTIVVDKQLKSLYLGNAEFHSSEKVLRADLEARLTEAQGKLAQATSSVETAHAELDKARDGQQVAEETLRRLVVVHEDSHKKQETEAIMLQESCARLDSELADTRDELVTARAYQQTQQEMVRRLQTSLQTSEVATNELKRVNDELDVAEHTARELRADLAVTHASHQATEKANFRLQGELESLSDASENLNSELRAELETTRSSQQAGEMMTIRLQSELRSLRNERVVLAESIQVTKQFTLSLCGLRVHIAVFRR